jgi:hypothetical protein
VYDLDYAGDAGDVGPDQQRYEKLSYAISFLAYLHKYATIITVIVYHDTPKSFKNGGNKNSNDSSPQADTHIFAIKAINCSSELAGQKMEMLH